MTELEQLLNFRKSVGHPGHDMILAILTAARKLIVTGDRLVREYGLTDRQRNLLMLLRHQAPEGATQVELGTMMCVGKASMTGLVDRLERDGLVERCRLSHDRRAHLVRLTLNGRKALAAVEKPYFRALDHTLAGISAADRQKAIRVLVDICRSLDNEKGGRK